MNTAIALGTFDGVHRGHIEIIEAAKRAAAGEGLESVIYTFTAHPMAAFKKEPPLLMENGERLAALSNFCRAEAEEFTLEYAATPPEKFIEALVSRFGMAHAVAGFNYTFGHRGAGNTKLLMELGERMGFRVTIVEPVTFEGEPVSSTRIRASLEEGNISAANEMLGYRYKLSGIIGSNRHIGRSIGFPTANLMGAEGRVIPADGVYASIARTRGREYAAVTNIGMNPTVNGSERTIEAHLSGFEGDLYGERMEIGFAARLRGEIRFNSVQELAAQIASDERKALQMLEKQAENGLK